LADEVSGADASGMAARVGGAAVGAGDCSTGAVEL